MIFSDDVVLVFVYVLMMFNYGDFGEVDFVIEFVVEKEDVKVGIIEKLCFVLKFDVYIVLNMFLIFIMCFVL